MIFDSETHSSVDESGDATESRFDESYPTAAAAAAAAAPRAPVAEAAAASSSSPAAAAAAAGVAAVSADGRCRAASVSQRALHMHRASETAQGEGTAATPAGSHQLPGIQPIAKFIPPDSVELSRVGRCELAIMRVDLSKSSLCPVGTTLAR